MFKKINFSKLNYKELNEISNFSLKKDEITSFYQTFDFLDLLKKWSDIVGHPLSRVTTPLKIKFDALIILTRHSAYSQELSFLQEEIKLQIFKEFPELKKVIKKILFQTDEQFFRNKERIEQKLSPQKSILHPMSPEFRIKKSQGEKLFNHINDEELRKILVSIFIQS